MKKLLIILFATAASAVATAQTHFPKNYNVDLGGGVNDAGNFTPVVGIGYTFNNWFSLYGRYSFEVVFMACAEALYAALGSTPLTESHEAQKEIVMPLMPQFEPIFKEYPLEDSEFPASCEYDQMKEKLSKKAEELMRSVIQVEKAKVDLPF